MPLFDAAAAQLTSAVYTNEVQLLGAIPAIGAFVAADVRCPTWYKRRFAFFTRSFQF